MCAGRHAAEFTVLRSGADRRLRFLGLARPEIDVETDDAPFTDQLWGMFYASGVISHGLDDDASWGGQKGFGEGDAVGLLLDCDAGTLTVKKNGKRLGVAVTGGLTWELC
jgi:hypothetical protein